ncbi:MAG: UDP-N-acetylmuramoyl-L-alanine--D-glutamate ligase [Patescibacteria group bacterium]
MKHWKDFFKGKRVTLMGLGLLGRGLGDAIFLAEHGAELIVTDLRDEKTLAPSLEKIQRYKNIRYTLGKHKLEDFRNRDFILKAAGVAFDSPYIAEAEKHGIPVEMDASLFAKLMPKGVTLVGVTGTRGKSTTAELLYSILKTAKMRAFLGGVVHTTALPLLKKARAGDIVALELDSWQLQGFHGAKISPQVAVFTTFLDDHLVYYKGDRERYFEDKAAIFRYQKASDVLVVGEQVLKGATLPLKKGRTFKIARKADVPKDWKIPLLGEHNLENIACAIVAARALGVPDSVIKGAVERFEAVPGRLEYLRTVKGVKIYNDNNATTPDATIAALKALSPLKKGAQPSAAGGLSQLPKAAPFVKGDKSIVLIMGGTDKGLDMSKLAEAIPQYCKAAVLLQETGTEKLLSEFPRLKSPLTKGAAASSRSGVVVLVKETLKACLDEAMKIAEKGDTVLFSPAFASFGRWFKNEYDRGEQFVEIVGNL